MALTKETTEDKIEVVGDYKAIQIRTATVIKDDGTEVSRSFHRKVIHPCVKSGNETDGYTWSDTDTSSESTEVQAIASAVWTDAVKTAYKTMVDAQSI